jgi:hypothetical protein
VATRATAGLEVNGKIRADRSTRGSVLGGKEAAGPGESVAVESLEASGR